MGVKFAVAMGAHVTVFSSSPNKEEDAKRLGAKRFVVTKDPMSLKPFFAQFDLILDTVSAKHDIIPYIRALAPHGVLAIVGTSPSNHKK